MANNISDVSWGDETRGREAARTDFAKAHAATPNAAILDRMSPAFAHGYRAELAEQQAVRRAQESN